MSFFCIKLCFVDSKDTPSLFSLSGMPANHLYLEFLCFL